MEGATERTMEATSVSLRFLSLEESRRGGEETKLTCCVSVPSVSGGADCSQPRALLAFSWLGESTSPLSRPRMPRSTNERRRREDEE